jgi:hypothetical protein
MPEPYTDTLATVAAGRTALVERLRTIAASLEALPLDSACARARLLVRGAAGWQGRAAAFDQRPTSITSPTCA